jgi:hypothetical protein
MKQQHHQKRNKEQASETIFHQISEDTRWTTLPKETQGTKSATMGTHIAMALHH